MSSLFFCEKAKVVWEETSEAKSVVIYKKDKYGNFVNDKDEKKYQAETDENGNMKKKKYNKTIHVYKGFPSYGLKRKNIPCNKDEIYFIDASLTT